MKRLFIIVFSIILISYGNRQKEMTANKMNTAIISQEQENTELENWIHQKI